MEHLNPIDELFSQLQQDEMTPSTEVWTAIEAQQKAKRRRMVWLWSIASLLLITAGLSTYLVNTDSKNSMPLLSDKTEMPKQLADQSAAQPESTIQTEQKTENQVVEKVYNTPNTTSSLNIQSDKKNHAVVSEMKKSEKMIVKNEVEEVTAPINQKKVDPVANTSAKSEEEKPIQPNIEKPENNNKQDFKEEKENKKPKKTEKQHGLYWEGNAFIGRTFRNLQGNTNYQNIRNGSEISVIRPSASVKLGYVFNKNFSANIGLGYFSHAISASYIYTPDRIVYDSATGNTYTIPGTKGATGDQVYNYIRIPVLAEYTFGVGKLYVFTNAGFASNILISNHGFIQDPDNPQAGNLMKLANLPVRKVGIDAVIRAGSIFPLSDKYSATVGAVFNYGLTSAFNKSAPVKQHNFSYGLEVGLRYHFKL